MSLRKWLVGVLTRWSWRMRRSLLARKHAHKHGRRLGVEDDKVRCLECGSEVEHFMTGWTCPKCGVLR